MPTNLDLTLTLKEAQVQHGLRSEDYARYHRYLTNRLASLRKQLGLANDKKKFLNKQNPNNAHDARYHTMLAMYAERCWAEAEELMKAAQNDKEAQPPATQPRKRLNKAVKWAEKLVAASEATGNARLKIEAQAYFDEMQGRCALGHGDYPAAKSFFEASRKGYYKLLGAEHVSGDEQAALMAAKVVEVDDRVVHAMQCNGEAPNTYKPDVSALKGTAAQHGGTVEWLGRELTIFNVKVKESLREVSIADVFAARDAAVAGAGTSSSTLPTLIAVGQQSRVLDAFDRALLRFNDALQHCRQDLRAATDARKQSIQLLIHYLSYHVSLLTYERTTFMVEVFSRRFTLTKEALKRKAAGDAVLAVKKQGGALATKREVIPPSLYASPAEVVRLYDLALQSVDEMGLLPGVEDHKTLGPEVEAREAQCKAGKMLYTAESWRLAEDPSLAMASYGVAVDAAPKSEAASAARRGQLELTAETALNQDATAASEVTSAKRFVISNPDEMVACNGIVSFPPDYQAVPCKPVFVDVASTYIDFPTLRKAGGAKAAPVAAPAKSSEAAKGGEGDKQAGWFSGWGWGKK